MAKLLDRAAILAFKDQQFEEVECPEWGGVVRLCSLTGAERDAFEDAILTQPDKSGQRRVITANIRARLVALTAVDAQGQRLFTDADVAALGAKNAAALDRLFAASQRLSGLSKGDVEELAKNSEAARSGGSVSASPSA